MPPTTEPLCGKGASAPFPSYPHFISTSIPENVYLETISGGVLAKNPVQPIRAWQGTIQPFVDDQCAREAMRTLQLDRPVDVAAGRISVPPEVGSVIPSPQESRLIQCDVVFDVLVLEFESPAHPWVFSLAPTISKREFPDHPHLRADRILQLPSRTVCGLCLYSAAEFEFDPNIPAVPQLLNQVAIFLGKHIIWTKIRRLFDVRRGVIIDEGMSESAEVNRIPINSIWQAQPVERWLGFWPGTSAASGRDHLSLNPHGPCWCGSGLLYGDCHHPEEEIMWGRQ